MLVADDLERLPCSLHEPEAAQHPVHGRGGQAQGGADPVGTVAGRETQARDLALLRVGQPARAAMRPAAAIVQPGVAVGPPAGQPAVVEAPAHLEGETRRGDGEASLDGPEDLRPTSRRAARVGVTMHEGALPIGCLVRTSNLVGVGSSRVTNVLREQS
jgi:hypothetical protein